jgi:exodeoxyribonuclease VII small subunit
MGVTMAKKKTRPAKTRASGGGDKDVNFEEALARLESLVERLEEGEIPLDESLEAYAEGTRLVKLCLKELERADTLIRELSEDTDGFRLTSAADQKELGAGDADDPQDDLGF